MVGLDLSLDLRDDEAAHDVVLAAWNLRARIELDAESRFTRLAHDLSSLGSPTRIVQAFLRAAQDEHRHARLCATLAAEKRTGTVQLPEPLPAADVAPPGLSTRDSILYEVVAACCITETVSVCVLKYLLDQGPLSETRRVLHHILRDEVNHSRMGWAHLQHEASTRQLHWLSKHIPAMLAGAMAEQLFESSGASYEDPSLLPHGVLPPSDKKEQFVGTVTHVVFPGLEAAGIDTRAAREWMATWGALRQ